MSIFDITELIKICKYAHGKCVLELVNKQADSIMEIKENIFINVRYIKQYVKN